MTVTVAIPVRDGGELLALTLASVRAQRLEPEVELIVCDSGSRDGSVAVARNYGAEVIEIPPAAFSHGGTRNLLMERAQGEHVAFLTQDAVPADEQWLARLLAGFALADDVALVFGPYRPQPGASLMVSRELMEWFRFLSPDGQPRIDRLGADEREIPARGLLGPRGFFTDANGCIAKAVWESVPFRPVGYAEDHVLAHDMLRAGHAKVFLPEAAVLHSHEYTRWNWLRRSFDEARAMLEVYGFSEQGKLAPAAKSAWGKIGADWRCGRSAETGSGRRPAAAVLAASVEYHLLCAAGTILGARAHRLPRAVVRRLSLEGRSD